MRAQNKLATFPRKKIVGGLFSCFLIIGLTGCADKEVNDLTQFISTVKAKPKGIIPPLPEIKVVEPFIFNPEGLRNPFRPLERNASTESLDMSSDTGVLPDLSRRKEALEFYPLDSLKMVGTVTEKSNLWGLIKATDGTIHRVKKGNYMGLNYGEIQRVLGTKVELKEIIREKSGSWRHQQASLEMTE